MWPTFAQPLLLPLLALVPLLAWRGRRRSRAALVFSDLRGIDQLPRGRSVGAERGGLWLRLAGLSCLVLALSGPRWPDEGSRITIEGISLALVVDVSGSMAERDFIWDGALIGRLEGVQRVFRLLVAGGQGQGGEVFPGRPQDLMMFVPFATRPETACPLTLDHDALLRIVDAEQPRTLITEATTNPGDAIAWALNSLRKAPTRRKALILLTDGESNVPPPALTPRQAGQLAGNLRIPIYAIDAAPDNASPGDGVQARQTLKALAAMTDGAYFRATDGKSLSETLAAIDRLERDAIPGIEYRRYAEGYPWLALAALLLWALVLGLEATWWRRVP